VSRSSSEIARDLHELGYIGVGSTELHKKEVSFGAGAAIPNRPRPVETITMQLRSGAGNENVYADPQALIFHPDFYGDGRKNKQ
jgi:hypothetical protein